MRFGGLKANEGKRQRARRKELSAEAKRWKGGKRQHMKKEIKSRGWKMADRG
jgi:hypothetical protein